MTRNLESRNTKISTLKDRPTEGFHQPLRDRQSRHPAGSCEATRNGGYFSCSSTQHLSVAKPLLRSEAILVMAGRETEVTGVTGVTFRRVAGRALTKWRRNGARAQAHYGQIYIRPFARNRETGSTTGTASRRKIQRATAKPIAA